MTIDLKEHMAQKEKQRQTKAYDAIGKALHDMPMWSALHVLSCMLITITDQLPEKERMATAMQIFEMMVKNPTTDETVQ